ncbi:hypothetical protein CHLRE_03g207351v5 [Chlamydomonas reinhardtii]|uniref:Glycerophosphocholine acyltransferase 1 n=1 Tax=Chlamydomonas reinhardtii TaxID=3055 RepID=A0A2K3DYY3_CHLRE|nr:uncharacterized protein CHLRE_03g207351v5 [Chlamydomonas reinhardtii]PNW85743.1 hypothetical protein CHLRE_03g207351v5 [Chlamydomonas reinhardtii]
MLPSRREAGPERSPHGGDGDARSGTIATGTATTGGENDAMQPVRGTPVEATSGKLAASREAASAPAARDPGQTQLAHVQEGAGGAVAGSSSAGAGGSSMQAGNSDGADSSSRSGTADPAAPACPPAASGSPSSSTAARLPSPRHGVAAAIYGSRSANLVSPSRSPWSGGAFPGFGSGSSGLLAAVNQMDPAGSGPLSFIDVMESFGVAAAEAAAELEAAEAAEGKVAGPEGTAAGSGARGGGVAVAADGGRAAAAKDSAAADGGSSCGNGERGSGSSSSSGTASRGSSSIATEAYGQGCGSRPGSAGGTRPLQRPAQADGMAAVVGASGGAEPGGAASDGADFGSESGAESEDVVEFLDATDGGPGLVMAEAVLDMHEVFHELPEQLAALQEERREAVVTPQKRRRLVARLSGLRLFRRALGPRGLLLRDKLTFLLGVSMMWTCAFWLGRSPSSFYLLYGGVGAVLMAARWASYISRKWHYYLYDFCYYANLLLVLQLWLLPRWAPLAKVTFSYNTGPLAWSIITFRNSLVFHDLDKVTSLFLHLVPALVSWSLRWYGDPARFGPPPEATEQERERWHRAGGLSNVLLPMASYVVWAVAYYLKIFVFSRAKIQQRGYRTLFNYVTSQKKGTFHAIARRIPPPLQPPVYLFLHLCFCMTTFLVALGCWYSFWAHTALLAAVASASIWHGGSYYFEVFARKYHEHLMPKAAAEPAPAHVSASATKKDA